MSALYCPVDTKYMIIVTVYIACPLHGICSILVLPLLFVHITSFLKKKMKIPTKLFIVTTIFYFSCFMALALASIQAWFQCYNWKSKIFRNCANQVYATETILLCGILYYRLYFIFRKTRDRLSKCTNVCFWIFYIITALVFIAAGITFVNYPKVSPVILLLAWVLILLIIIFLDTSFIYKLYKTMSSFDQKNENEADSASSFLSDTITKNSILALLSTIFTIFFALVSVLYSIINTAYMDLLLGVFYNADILTNCICVALTFRYFGGYYDKLCSCCHVKCHRLWDGCIQRKRLKSEIAGNIKTDTQQHQTGATHDATNI